jgi:glycosyltransferase involved in cell wall biosynthesis
MPVIASNYPTYGAVIEGASCGLCVDPDAPEQLANAIEWLMDHPSEAAEMGRRGRRAVIQQYSWRREAAKLLRFCDVLLAPTLGAPVAGRAQTQ